jgi:hypothetical protein
MQIIVSLNSFAGSLNQLKDYGYDRNNKQDVDKTTRAVTNKPNQPSYYKDYGYDIK